MREIKLLLSCLSALVVIAGFGLPASAKDIDVSCGQGSCRPGVVDGFFSKDNLKPGQDYFFNLKLTNTDSASQNIILRFKPKTNNQVFKFYITDADRLIYEGYLTEEVSLNLGKLEPQKAKQVAVKISTASDTGNEWQGASFDFDSNVYMELGEAGSTESETTDNQPKPTQATPTGRPKPARLPTQSNQTNLGKVLGKTSQDDILASQTETVKPTNFYGWPGLLLAGLLVWTTIIVAKKRVKLKR